MLKTALLFQDHMVLQREKRIAFWGTAEKHAAVSVTLQGRTVYTGADAAGNWRAEIGPLRASWQETVEIRSGEERVTLEDVQVGEVWLAAGQSNMEFHMRYDADLEAEIPKCTNNAIRFFDYPKVSYPEQIHEADYGRNFGFWRKAEPEQLPWFSAAGYYFAKEIQQTQSVPVGIVGCNWGGTPACAWMSGEAIRESGGEIWLEEYREAVQDLDLPAYEEAFRQNPGSWKLDPFADPVSEMLMKGMNIADILFALTGQKMDPAAMDVSAQMPAMGPRHECRPGGLYESMLCRVAPYGLRGILFYQGESDGDKHPQLYETLFPGLIRCFRDLWKEELPFLFVQLAPFGSWMQSRGEPYAVIRQAQQHTARTVPNAAMAVISDIGMEWDIHPKKKKPVGQRLALLARRLVYQEDILCEAPTLWKMEAGEGELRLTFQHAGDGLFLAGATPDGARTDPCRLEGLELTLDGKALDMAQIMASAEGDTVILRAPVLRQGCIQARLGMGGWYRINLYNSAGLPGRPGSLTIG